MYACIWFQFLQADGEDPTIHSCKVESCAGWRLNKLPEVKKFIYEDLEKKYERTTFKKIPGKSPEMIFYNTNGEELERIDISKLKRDELNALIVAKGIPVKGKHDEVWNYFYVLSHPIAWHCLGISGSKNPMIIES